MDWKKEWKENRLGILSVLFLLAFALLWAIAVLQLFQPPEVLGWGLPIGIVFLALSFLKKEKNSQFRQISLAILALIALLVLLAVILGPHPPPRRNQPAVGAADALKEAYQSQYLLQTSQQSVTFTGETSITRKAIIEKANLGIGVEQLCLSLGDFSGSNLFEGTTQMITHKGAFSRNVSFSALCVPGEEMLSQIGEDGSHTDIRDEWTEGCECVQDPVLAKDTCCLMTLRYSR